MYRCCAILCSQLSETQGVSSQSNVNYISVAAGKVTTVVMMQVCAASSRSGANLGLRRLGNFKP